ncbi:MAG: hypothetical protein OXD30_00390 [Bryobacterales bacterium]|nr:hypothetical protein [Bryobacterales bacterium]
MNKAHRVGDMVDDYCKRCKARPGSKQGRFAQVLEALGPIGRR